MESWCSTLIEEKVFFQLLWLEGGAYLWIGSGDHRLDSLAVGVPASAGARGRAATPSATTLLGGHEGDAGSQRLAQRLSSKVGRPIFVSLNLRDDPQLRLFAEREAVAALTARVAAPSTTSASGAAGLERLSSLALDAAPSQAVPAAPAAPAPAPAPVSSSPAAGVAGGAGDGTARGARTREVFASPDGLATRAVALLLEAAAAAIAERGVFVVAVSGGSIPALLAPELLAAAPRDQLSRWRLFLADERHV